MNKWIKVRHPNLKWYEKMGHEFLHKDVQVRHWPVGSTIWEVGVPGDPISYYHYGYIIPCKDDTTWELTEEEIKFCEEQIKKYEMLEKLNNL